MEKIWFLLLDQKKEGPFTFQELKLDQRITPDTLAWKEGFSNWTPIREISELQDLFKDEEETKNENESTTINIKPQAIEENDVIALRKDPPFFNIWFLMVLFLILYAVYLLSQ